jgi:hypothetical protein
MVVRTETPDDRLHKILYVAHYVHPPVRHLTLTVLPCARNPSISEKSKTVFASLEKPFIEWE